MIIIENLSKSYVNGKLERRIFSCFSLEVEEKEKMGLFGHNGVGKSTLLNLLSGIDNDFKGSIKTGCKKIGYLHQDYNATLLNWFDCRENILLPLKYNKLDAKKGSLLLNDFAEELKINFPLERHPFELSGGQKQIVALLRALVCEPDVLLLDEPFSALDNEKRKAVIKLLKERFSDKTLIVCSHRGSEVKKLVERAIVLEGNPAKLGKDLNSESFRRNTFERIISKMQFRSAENEF